MSFWKTVKQGFGWGFGGTLGWHLGNLVARLIGRLWKLGTVALVGMGMSHWANTPPAPPMPKEKPSVMHKQPVGHVPAALERRE